MNADTAWKIWKLNREEVKAYLQRRKDQKFNTIAIVTFPFPQDGIVPNASGDRPFAVSQGKWDPTQPIVTPGSDPVNAYEYDFWDQLDYVIDTASSTGMYIILLPCWGEYVAGSWNGEDMSNIIFDSRNAYIYGRWIGNRYKDYPQVIWMIGGDRSAVYGSGKDYREVFRALAEGVADGVNGILNRQDAEGILWTSLDRSGSESIKC